MSQDSDLSDYERVRLENIRRNNEFLAQLGLVPLKPIAVKVETARPAPKASQKVKREQEDSVPQDKRRRSSRLSENFVKLEESTEVKVEDSASEALIEEPDASNFYERVPQESDQLDDYEFQVFVELRRWRLHRSRELMIAPYGLFQNRTFCELIRRRRNDATWATRVNEAEIKIKEESGSAESEPTTKSVRSSPRKEATVKEEPTLSAESNLDVPVNNTDAIDLNTLKTEILYDPSVIPALTECYGIAAGKTRERGYAWEALAVLNKQKVCLLLEQSRQLLPGLVPVKKE